jgi:hypothetical protein
MPVCGFMPNFSSARGAGSEGIATLFRAFGNEVNVVAGEKGGAKACAGHMSTAPSANLFAE